MLGVGAFPSLKTSRPSFQGIVVVAFILYSGKASYVSTDLVLGGREDGHIESIVILVWRESSIK